MYIYRVIKTDMKDKVYKVDELEFVSLEMKSTVVDLRESEDNAILFQTVMHNPPLKYAYFNSDSLEGLKKALDRLYVYTEDQYEYLEENFKYDLED